MREQTPYAAVDPGSLSPIIDPNSMGTVPRVSVSIITYNQQDYLKGAIESVLSQGYPNMEIVIADDASTDGTADLLRDYSARHPDLFKILLADRNAGITANCNKALAACTGKYIAWLAGDDITLPGKLISQVEFLEANPGLAICYHDLEIFESPSDRVLGNFNSGPNSTQPRIGGAGQIVRHGAFLCASSVMTLRSACPATGFDEGIPAASDWLFWIETARKGDVGFIPEVLGRYRRHARSVTAREFDITEQLATLAIVEERYPDLQPDVRYSRAGWYRTLGMHKLESGDRQAARQLLSESLRAGGGAITQVKTLIFLCYMYCPGRIRAWARTLVANFRAARHRRAPRDLARKRSLH